MFGMTIEMSDRAVVGDEYRYHEITKHNVNKVESVGLLESRRSERLRGVFLSVQGP